MAHFTLRVPDPLALAFDAMAALRGGRSRVLRTLMENAVTKADGGQVTETDTDLSRGRSEKITLRLRPDDLAALDRASAAAGLRRTQWAVGCLRGRLLAKPTFNPEETRALVETRHELARISGNLRELVRTIREGDTPVEALESSLASVEHFRREVREQLTEVRAVLDGRVAASAGSS